jgi:hypothetical protein
MGKNNDSNKRMKRDIQKKGIKKQNKKCERKRKEKTQEIKILNI